MKKLTAAILALVMLLSFAMAETAPVEEINFENVLSAEELEKGNYILLQEDFPVEAWIPSEPFVEGTIPEDAASVGVFLVINYYEGTDNDAVAFMRLASDKPFDDLVAALKADTENFSQVEEAVVNGIRAVSYMAAVEDMTLAYVTYEIAEGDFLSIYFQVTDNQDYLQMARLVALSVRRYDDSEG